MKMIKTIMLFSFLFFLPVEFLSAETIILKSGKKVEADILEKTDEYIKVDFYGVELTYYFEDIAEIKDLSASKKVSEPRMIKMKGLTIDEPAKPYELFSSKNNLSDKHFLWKVKSANSTVYLLGSIHMATSDLYPLDQVIETAFRNSQILVVEANINNVYSSMDALMSLTDSITSQNSSLQDVLSASTYSLLRSKLDELSIPVEYFDSLQPWVLAITLEMMEFQKMGFDAKYGIDSYFLQKSQGKKRIIELESVEYQIGIFKSFTNREQDVFLLSTLQSLDDIAALSKLLLKAWKVGDIAAMKSFISPDPKIEKRLSSVNNKLYGIRNHNMTKKIDNFLNQGKNYFVVVGTGHLVGENGIVALLREKGYVVEQM